MSQKYKSYKLADIDAFIDNHLKKGTLDRHVNQLLEAFTADAIVQLFRLINNPDTPPGIKLKCIEVAIERSLGKVNQGINITGNINHKHIVQGVILMPQEVKQTPIKLDKSGMPVLELSSGSLAPTTDEPILDAHYEELTNKDSS
jgi:hypothetical protein